VSEKLFDILDPMPFGKHRGKLIGTVIEEDPRHIYWAINNTYLRLNDVAMKYLRENLE